MEFSGLQEALMVMGVAALPISELRGAIPLAIVHYQMTPLAAYLLSVVGNLVPVLFILALLEPIVRLLRHVQFLNRFFEAIFGWTRRRHTARVERWGAVALVILVAIPLPMTGAWTGSMVAYLFGFRFWQALGLITLGVLIAGVIVMLFTLGASQVIQGLFG